MINDASVKETWPVRSQSTAENGNIVVATIDAEKQHQRFTG
jgi:SOS-response transcriptional repressor LexA